MARSFSGSDKIAFTTPAAANGLLTRSLSVWVLGDASPSGYDIVFFKGTTTPDRYLRFQYDNAPSGWGMTVEVGWSTNPGIWSIDFPDTAFHHYLITYDGGSTSNDPNIYKDGTLQSEVERITPSGTHPTDTTVLEIGDTWQGDIAEVGYWGRILTAADAVSLSKGLSPLFFPAGLEFYTPFNPNLGVGTATFTKKGYS